MPIAPCERLLLVIEAISAISLAACIPVQWPPTNCWTAPKTINGKVFPLNKTTVRSLWERTCKKTNIKGLRFHDLRHEATSRLFEKGLSIMEVASITGHKDIRMLRIYTHLQTNNLVKKLDTESIEYI